MSGANPGAGGGYGDGPGRGGGGGGFGRGGRGQGFQFGRGGGGWNTATTPYGFQSGQNVTALATDVAVEQTVDEATGEVVDRRLVNVTPGASAVGKKNWMGLLPVGRGKAPLTTFRVTTREQVHDVVDRAWNSGSGLGMEGVLTSPTEEPPSAPKGKYKRILGRFEPKESGYILDSSTADGENLDEPFDDEIESDADQPPAKRPKPSNEGGVGTGRMIMAMPDAWQGATSPCANCGGNHTLYICTTGQDDGYVHGCTLCNTGDHNIDNCERIVGTLAIFHYAVLHRGNMAPLKTVKSWDAIVKEAMKLPGFKMPAQFPWFPEFTQLVKGHAMFTGKVAEWYKSHNRMVLPFDRLSRKIGRTEFGVSIAVQAKVTNALNFIVDMPANPEPEMSDAAKLWAQKKKEAAEVKAQIQADRRAKADAKTKAEEEADEARLDALAAERAEIKTEETLETDTKVKLEK